MPVIIIFLLIKAFRDKKILNKNQYKVLVGVFYEDFGKKRFEGLLYYLIYILRRIIYLIISFKL